MMKILTDFPSFLNFFLICIHLSKCFYIKQFQMCFNSLKINIWWFTISQQRGKYEKQQPLV